MSSMASYGDAMCSWRKEFAPSVGAPIFQIKHGRAHVGRNVLPISHGLLAVSRHYGLFGNKVVTDGATVQTAFDSVVCC